MTVLPWMRCIRFTDTEPRDGNKEVHAAIVRRLRRALEEFMEFPEGRLDDSRIKVDIDINWDY